MAFDSRAARLLAVSVVFALGCGTEPQMMNDPSTGAASSGSGSGSGSNLAVLGGCAVFDLISDRPNAAANLDLDLIDPWGFAMDATDLYIADNGTGALSIVDPNGVAATASPARPMLDAGIDGIVRNTSETAFQLHTGSTATGCAPASFLVSSESGKIWGVNLSLSPSPMVVVDRSAQRAVYKGLAIVAAPSGMRLVAADFHNARIDVFDDQFAPMPSGSFADPSLPAGFAPFDVVAIGDRVYVSYAQQDQDAIDDVPGSGLGQLDVFDPGGTLIRTLVASGGALDAPWGLAMAPAAFCGSSGPELLAGNFGDGTIVAIDAGSGAVLGRLGTVGNHPIVIDGLWGLGFGDGQDVGQADWLYFAAGPDMESHGQFGRIVPVTDPP